MRMHDAFHMNFVDIPHFWLSPLAKQQSSEHEKTGNIATQFQNDMRLTVLSDDCELYLWLEGVSTFTPDVMRSVSTWNSPSKSECVLVITPLVSVVCLVRALSLLSTVANSSRRKSKCCTSFNISVKSSEKKSVHYLYSEYKPCKNRQRKNQYYPPNTFENRHRVSKGLRKQSVIMKSHSVHSFHNKGTHHIVQVMVSPLCNFFQVYSLSHSLEEVSWQRDWAVTPRPT